MNYQPTWVTQNAIPREQELISLGEVIMTPEVGLKSKFLTKNDIISSFGKLKE